MIRELAELGFLARAENILLLGPTGTGKSHLSIAIGIRACMVRKRVLFRLIAEGTWVRLTNGQGLAE